ncbi:hypothetical protein K2173_020600 [Erythroxylum novogranatense]|uniref:C2H2-type domain-containing protein n=1 Tax=Erythroxylum novogranatense TaxID=1862640 RepID=A0AAV8TIY0_9ROSI|nr:hypothetical protein K2173_020600 [Erythroxylum novogranatense]
MEAPEEVITHIAKGKRTKRQKVQSPIPFALTTNSPGGDGRFIIGDHEYANNNNSCSSPASSNNIELPSDNTEDEDMANCLILLAQGHSRDSPKPDNAAAGVHYNNHANVVVSNNNNTNKFSSRKFLETSTASGKVGYYVYECKTCNRTFPSFQALGGHRASHKKPKTTTFNNDEKKHMALSSDEEDGNYKNISSLSLQLIDDNNNRGTCSNLLNKGKVHECSICGAEFTSGQALGGHMRRHRAPMGNSTTNLSLTPMTIEYHEEPKKARNLFSFGLDLNLPAPEDDRFSSFASKQQQKQKQQQQQQDNTPLVLSTPALVDCHY